MRGNPVVPPAISRGHSTDPPSPMETGRAERYLIRKIQQFPVKHKPCVDTLSNAAANSTGVS